MPARSHPYIGIGLIIGLIIGKSLLFHALQHTMASNDGAMGNNDGAMGDAMWVRYEIDANLDM